MSQPGIRQQIRAQDGPMGGTRSSHGWQVALALTGEELKDEEAPAHMIEDLVPEQAPGLIAALSHVQNHVPPHYLHKKRSPQSTSYSFIALVRGTIPCITGVSKSCRNCCISEKGSSGCQSTFQQEQRRLSGIGQGGIQQRAHPGCEEVAEGKREDDGGGGCVGQSHDVDEHNDPNLTAIADAEAGVAPHLLLLVAGPCAKRQKLQMT